MFGGGTAVAVSLVSRMFLQRHTIQPNVSFMRCRHTPRSLTTDKGRNFYCRGGLALRRRAKARSSVCRPRAARGPPHELESIVPP